MAPRVVREHQVKVSICQADANDIAAFARADGVGAGTFIRLLALKHCAAMEKNEVPAVIPSMFTRDQERKLGCHIAVLFSEDEHQRLQRAAAAAELTVSSYLARAIVERWLRARRARIAKSQSSG
jgi:hypothetical protein